MNTNHGGDECVMSVLKFSENLNHTRLSARQVRHMISKFDDFSLEPKVVTGRYYNGDVGTDAEMYLERKRYAIRRSKYRAKKKKQAKERALRKFNENKPKKCSIKADTEFDDIMSNFDKKSHKPLKVKPESLSGFLEAKHTVTINIVERLLCHAVIFANLTSKVALTAQLIMMFNDLTGITLTDVVIQAQVIPHLLAFMGHKGINNRLAREAQDRENNERYQEMMMDRYRASNPNWERMSDPSYEIDEDGEPVRVRPEFDKPEVDPILKLGGFLADSIQQVCAGDSTKITNSILFNKFANVCQYLCMAPILLTLGLINKAEDWINFRTFITTSLSNVKGVIAIVDFVKECKDGIVEYFSLPVDKRDLAVFFRMDKLTKWSSQVLEFCNFAHDKDWMQDMFDGGNGIASRHTVVQNAVTWAEEQYAIGKRLSLNATFESRWAGVYNTLLTRLSSITIELKGELAGGKIRPVPFSILIYGEPGVMKSRFAHATLDVLAHVYGIENVPGNLYVRNPGADHHDGAQGGQRMWFFDDLAQAVAKMTADSLVGDIIGGINTISPLLKMADLKHKSVTTCDAEVVVATTNDKQFQASVYFRAPAAALRRFPFVVTLEVKPELLQKGGTMMRADIIVDDEDLDRWIITVEEVIVLSKYSVRYDTILKKASASEYFEWLSQTSKKWKEKQLKIHTDFMNRNKSVCKHGYPGSRCPRCKVENITAAPANAAPVDFLNDNDTPRMRGFYDKYVAYGVLTEFDTWLLYEQVMAQFSYKHGIVPVEPETDSAGPEITLTIPEAPGREVVGPHTMLSRWSEWIDENITPFSVGWLRPLYSFGNFLYFNIRVFWKLRSWITWDLYKKLIFTDDSTPIGIMRKMMVGEKPVINEEKLFVAASAVTKLMIVLALLGIAWKLKNALVNQSDEKLKEANIMIPCEGPDPAYEYYRMHGKDDIVKRLKESDKSDPNSYSKHEPVVPEGFKMATREEIEAVQKFSAKLGLPDSDIPVVRVNTPRKWEIVVPKRNLGDISHWKNPTWQDKLGRALETNMVSIRSISATGECNSFKGFFINCTSLLIPGHGVPDRGEFTLVWAPGTVNSRCIKIQISPSIVIKHKTKDLALVHVGMGLSAKKVLNYFLSKDSTMISGLPLEVVEADSSENITRRYYPVTKILKVCYTVDRYYEYNTYSYTGDGANYPGKCGAIAVGTIDAGNFIAGIHIAGLTELSTGYILPVYQEDIIEMSSNFPAAPSHPDDDDMVLNGKKVEVNRVVPEGHVISKYLKPSGLAVLGCISGTNVGHPKSEVVATPLQTTYDPAKVFGPPRFGGFMHEGKWVSNTENKLNHYANHDYSLDPELERIASKMVIERAKKLCDFSKVGPMSFSGAISGVAGSVINKINEKTSAGPLFPGIKEGYMRLLNMVQADVVITDKVMLTALDMIIDRYSKGLSAMFTFGWSDKDEPIKQSKTLSGGTRVFNPSPLTLLILMRIFFEPIAAELLRDPHKFAHKIGINAVSKDWDKIVSFLVDPSAGFQDGTLEPTDQKAYDARTELYCCLLNLIDLVRDNGNYTNEQLTIMEMLAYDASHSGLLINSCVVFSAVGSLSGTWQTALTNSWMLEKLELQAYLIAARNHLKYFGSWEELLVFVPYFYDVVRLVLYGDDTIINKHKNILTWYTVEARVQAFALLGFEVTSDVKGENPAQKMLSECTFLKRSFRYDLERRKWACPLELASIYKSLAWEMGHPTLSHSEYMTALVDNAEREFFQHGRDMFDRETSKLKEALSQAPVEWRPNHTWRTYEDMMMLSDERLFSKDM